MLVLPSGVVKLSFGVLRGAAPQLFSVGEQFDARDFELPLNEILVRINPALLPRPANQKIAPVDSIEDSFIVPVTPAPAPHPVGKGRGARGEGREGAIASSLGPLASSPALPKPSSASPVRETMSISLASLATAWPSEVRAEIAQLNCMSAQVALPEQLVKLGMKQGKVAFPWQIIRGWIHPAPASVVSKHDSTILNLPLEVLMPLFVSRLKQSPKTQSKLVVDESIPALFGPATPPEGGARGEGREGAIASSLGPLDSANANVPVSKPKTPATDFKNRYISPTEVVQRASALEGVAGALVVLPEGLLVAATVATDQNPDVLAAFLARALGRVNQCAEEAQIGELSHLEFAAQSVPWKIFRLHGVLFAAFGRADGALPLQQLAAIAGEFDRKKRG